MGFADRDYSRQPAPGGFGGWPSWSVTVWLIAVNVAVFIVDGITKPYSSATGLLTRLGEYTIPAVVDLQVWRLITFQFLHANVGHILFNLIALYFFGPLVEEYLGARRFIAFYLLCGIAGAVLFTILEYAHVLVVDPAGGLVGASAGIFGVLIGAACIAPNSIVNLMFVIQIPLRVLAWILVGVAVLTVFSKEGNTGGEAGHLGGALLGYLLIRNPQWLNIFARAPRARRPRRGFRMDDWR